MEKKIESQAEETSAGNRIVKRIEWEGGGAVIRHAGQEDLDGYLGVVADKRKKWKEEGKKLEITPIDDKEIEFRKKVIEADQDGKMVFLVVEADGQVCGYIDIRRNTDIDMMKPTAFQKVESLDYNKATIVDITVRSGYRGKHFGQNLVEAGIEEAKRVLGINSIELETDEDNYGAIKVYERLLEFKGFALDSEGKVKTKKRDDKTVKRPRFEKQL